MLRSPSCKGRFLGCRQGLNNSSVIALMCRASAERLDLSTAPLLPRLPSSPRRKPGSRATGVLLQPLDPGFRRDDGRKSAAIPRPPIAGSAVKIPRGDVRILGVDFRPPLAYISGRRAIAGEPPNFIDPTLIETTSEAMAGEVGSARISVRG